MAIRITGLNSGMDTDSIVQELVSANRLKVEKYEKAQTKLQWTQDTWKDMNSKIYGFYSKSLSNMRLDGSFAGKKTTTVSDSTKATVVAGSGVDNGTQTLEVKSLATAAYLTGAQVKQGINRDSTLAELGISNGQKLTINTKGKNHMIFLSEDMKVSDVLDKLKDAGLSAKFDVTNRRFFINSGAGGTENDFEFKASSESDLKALQGLGIATEKNYQQLGKPDPRNIELANQVADENGVKLTSSKLREGIDGQSTLADLGFQGSQKIYFEANGTKHMIQFSEDTKIEDFVEKLNFAGLDASFDEVERRFTIENGTGIDTFRFTASNEGEFANLEKLGLVTEKNYQEMGKADPRKIEFAVKSEAENAEIVLNGATFKSSSNEFKINGLTITATAETTGPVTITTATDVDGIYNMIKDFLGEYNTLVNAMEAAYNADSSKGYEPLTDDEKSAMSDEEVEKWEKKIKDSLLRRDNTLSGIMSGLSSVMGKSYEIDGKKYALSSFGIATTGYFSRVKNESYAYHIDGDPDDSLTEGKDDKLKKMIAEDPDAVMEFFTQLSTDLYENLDAKMKSTSLRSSYTVYNDKQMKKEYDEYTKTIKKWEEKLIDIEDRYYKQFATMERILGEMQSQTSSLGSLFGGGMM